MTDSNTTPAKADTKAAAKTVAKDMDERRIFTTQDDALAYLAMCAETYTDFAEQTLASPGLTFAEDDSGEVVATFDPEIYTDQMNVMISTLSKKGKGVAAVIIAPVPKLDAILASESGLAWLNKIVAKELNHVAVRQLREAEDISVVVDQMPTTLDAYISTSRESSGIMATFDALFKQIIDGLGEKVAVWKKARLTKGELKKAMESKAYAEEYYPALENRGEGKDSLFVFALNLGNSYAKAKGLDPAIFGKWLATRDEKAFTAGDEEEDDFDVESLTASLLKEDAKPADPAAPAPAADTTKTEGDESKTEA